MQQIAWFRGSGTGPKKTVPALTGIPGKVTMVGMKRLLILFMIFTFTGAAFAQTNFQPPPESEEPLFGFEQTPTAQITGITLTSAGLAGGIGLTVFGITKVIDGVPGGINDPGLQQGIMISASGLVISAILSVCLDFFLEPYKDFTLFPFPAADRDEQE